MRTQSNCDRSLAAGDLTLLPGAETQQLGAFAGSVRIAKALPQLLHDRGMSLMLTRSHLVRTRSPLSGLRSSLCGTGRAPARRAQPRGVLSRGVLIHAR